MSVHPCPKCGETLGGRYRHNGQMLCWPCWGIDPYPAEPPRPADPDWIHFRKAIIDALWTLDRDRFAYLDEDTIVGACPICAAELPEYLVVRFHGKAPRADVSCSLGCNGKAIARALGPRKARR